MSRTSILFLICPNSHLYIYIDHPIARAAVAASTAALCSGVATATTPQLP